MTATQKSSYRRGRRLARALAHSTRPVDREERTAPPRPPFRLVRRRVNRTPPLLARSTNQALSPFARALWPHRSLSLSSLLAAPS